MVDLFSTGYTVVVVVIAIVAVLVVVGLVRNARRARQHGLDPLTLQAGLAAKVMHSDLLGAERGKPDRLAELDQMLASGSITEVEHGEARAAILRE